MKKADVKIGKVYLAKVSGKRARVRITGESPYGGWAGINLDTRRKVRIKSAQRLQREISDPDPPAPESLPEPEPETIPSQPEAAANESEMDQEQEAEPEPEVTHESTPEAHLTKAATTVQEPEPEVAHDVSTETTPEAAGKDAESDGESSVDGTTEATQAQQEGDETASRDKGEVTGDGETVTPDEADTGQVKLSKLSVPELRALHLELTGRETRSDNHRYLVWRVRQAQKGRIPVGPRKTRRADGAAPDFRVLPLRLEANTVVRLDEAWKRLGLRSRMELIRRALGLYLEQAGEGEVAELFQPGM